MTSDLGLDEKLSVESQSKFFNIFIFLQICYVLVIKRCSSFLSSLRLWRSMGILAFENQKSGCFLQFFIHLETVESGRHFPAEISMQNFKQITIYLFRLNTTLKLRLLKFLPVCYFFFSKQAIKSLYNGVTIPAM